MRLATLALLLFTAAASSPAVAAGDRPIVVELFTSQGCSSCPPADAVLLEMSRDRLDILPLAFHVDYWNGLGWKDPFSGVGGTQRQRDYAVLLAQRQIYTPQMVIDGRLQAIGSDRAAVDKALASAVPQASVPVRIARQGASIAVELGAGAGAGTVWLAGYDPLHQTPVGRGENGGRTLTEANIVRSFEAIGKWSGGPMAVTRAIPAGERLAVIVQAADGRILGAAREP